VFACNDSVALFAPLRIFSISPFCGPASGETKLTLIGTSFADTEKLRIRFRYGDYAIEEECDYDVHSNSI